MSVRVQVKNLQILLEVGMGAKVLSLDTSLQRHHYNFMEDGAAADQNSLFHHNVAVATVQDDVEMLGKAIEDILWKEPRRGLFGAKLDAGGRKYLVDNVAQNANLPVNHFFPVSGSKLWENMSLNEWALARSVRRVQVAFEAKSKPPELLDAKRVAEIIRSGAQAGNPVIIRYIEARTQFRNTQGASGLVSKLEDVSGQRSIVQVIADLGNGT